MRIRDIMDFRLYNFFFFFAPRGFLWVSRENVVGNKRVYLNRNVLKIKDGC